MLLKLLKNSSRSMLLKLLNFADTLKTGGLGLVRFVEPTSPRGYYALARVMSLNYDKDNVTGSANLGIVSGNYTRPLVKLVPVLASSWLEGVKAI